MATVQKKSEVNKRHKLAISHFRKWLKENPKARRRQRVEMFDFLVDTAGSLNEDERGN